MAAAAQQIADRECGGEYKWIFNTGASVGQTVFHAHVHGWDGVQRSAHGLRLSIEVQSSSALESPQRRPV